MKTILASAFLLFAIAAPATVHAGDVRLGAQLLYSPDGRQTYDVPGEEVLTNDLDASRGVAALVGYDVLPWLSVALVPSALFDVGFGSEEEGWSETFTALDVAARLTGRIPLGSSGIELQLHGGAGYSWMLESDDRKTTPSGLLIALGAGVAVPVSSRLSIVGDIGKTYGRHRTNARGYYTAAPVETVRHIGYSFDTLRIGLGVQATL